MKPLASVSELKAYAPNLASLEDTAIAYALESVSEWVHGTVGAVTPEDFGTDGIAVKIRKSKFDRYASNVYLPTKFATSLAKVNGVTYTGTIGTDYFLHEEELTFSNGTMAFVLSGDCPYVTFTLKGGSPTPADLRQAVLGMAAFELSKQNGQSVASQSLGPRSISFSEGAAPEGVQRFSSVIQSYQPLSD